MIRLTIIKAPENGTLIGTDMVFGPGGGTIGRSRNSTWPLIDNEFLISRVHAEIYADNGQYFVADKSTNGLFLNHSRKPLGLGEATPLRGGDQLHLGHYTLTINLEAPGYAAAVELGSADFLEPTPMAPLQFEVDATPIPDHWLHETAPGKPAPTTTLITDRCDDLLAASWFENSLRMMLLPVIGNGINSMPASDLIALVTQLARTATRIPADSASGS